MNETTAAVAGGGAVFVGLGLLTWIIFRNLGTGFGIWIHIGMGVMAGSLLLLGGGFLGAIGDIISTVSDAFGGMTVQVGVGVNPGKSGQPTAPPAAIYGVYFGFLVTIAYLAMAKSGHSDRLALFGQGAVIVICLGGGAGVIGTLLGIFPTTGNTLGGVLLNTV
ncbi:hypothetical protein [Streptomyces sp. NPDC048272]|uniref:hypothetical protein n=1 Tax=Streptomyces sp. NPDC048272 TaxID=3154616 RepID=UPI003443FE13